MPPKKNPTTAGDAAASPAAAAGHNCTDSEIKLMLSILKHIPRPSTFDLEQIAEDLGSASAHSVRERIRQVGNKHGWFSAAAADGTASPKTPRARKTPVSRKKKQPAEEGDDEEQQLETPTKKRAKTAAGKAKVKAEEVKAEEEDDAGGEEIKPKVEEDDTFKNEAAEEG